MKKKKKNLLISLTYKIILAASAATLFHRKNSLRKLENLKAFK